MKCGHESEYVGEHWNEEEGYCSNYICKICYPKIYQKLKRSWQAHLRKCRNPTCDRCHGEMLDCKDCNHRGIAENKEVCYHPARKVLNVPYYPIPKSRRCKAWETDNQSNKKR